MSSVATDLALVFPGQGSQAVGMLADLARDWPVVEETFGQASEVLGQDLWALCQSGPAEALALTEVTQPLMLTAGVAVARVWAGAGGATAGFLAGHSLGEYTALVCAGALGFADAVALVRRRGQYMQQAVPPGAGAMAAVLGLPADAVEDLCREAAGPDVLAVANYNSPVQSVVAGNAAAVERLGPLARAAGARRVVALPVSAPFHCALMAPAAERLRDDLARTAFAAPRATVINNVDVHAPREPDAIRDALRRQVAAPVRWVEVVQALAGSGVRRVVECGPGGVLAGLGKRIAPAIEWACVDSPASLAAALASELNAGKDHRAS